MIKIALCAFMAMGVLVMDDDKKKDDEVNLKGIKCVVMGKRDAKAGKSVTLKDGTKLYMCCGNCVKAFEKKPEKYTVKANHQRVATGQYVQKACPFSGGKLNDAATCKVGGVELKMCCNGCAGKVNKTESEEAKAELVFNTKAFKKGFEKKAEKKDEKKKGDTSVVID